MDPQVEQVLRKQLDQLSVAEQKRVVEFARRLASAQKPVAKEGVGKLARSRTSKEQLEADYKAMAEDEEREGDALAWSEGTVGDVSDETR